MNQVTASVETHVGGHEKLMVTCYTGDCGCRWVVDMWGNVRTVEVCRRCMCTNLDRENQLAFELIPEVDA